MNKEINTIIANLEGCIGMYDYGLTPKASNLLVSYIKELKKENKKLNGAIQTYDILLKSNVEENKQLEEELKCTIGIVEHNRIINKKNKEIHQLKDNWNKLKEYANKMHEYFLYTDVNEIYKQSMKLDNQFPNLFNLSELNASDRILSSICKKMQELEQGGKNGG